MNDQFPLETYSTPKNIRPTLTSPPHIKLSKVKEEVLINEAVLFPFFSDEVNEDNILTEVNSSSRLYRKTQFHFQLAQEKMFEGPSTPMTGYSYVSKNDSSSNKQESIEKSVLLIPMLDSEGPRNQVGSQDFKMKNVQIDIFGASDQKYDLKPKKHARYY